MAASQTGLRGDERFPAIRFVDHPSFHDKVASAPYRRRECGLSSASTAMSHMPDDLTRELAKRMHYAAYRVNTANGSSAAADWRDRYFDLRDRIILGNRKLVFRAVQTRVRDPQLAEDCAAECHLVMIRAVSSYNPWLGIRFSTYVFTCLLRELTRLVQKQTKDRLRQALSFDDGLVNESCESDPEPVETDGSARKLFQFFSTEHPLLSDREKQVLSQRFGFNTNEAKATLKDIGIELSISKERVRQLQISGLGKLREVLVAEGVSE